MTADSHATADKWDIIVGLAFDRAAQTRTEMDATGFDVNDPTHALDLADYVCDRVRDAIQRGWTAG